MRYRLSMPKRPSRIHCTIDLAQQGRQVGDLYVKWSDNRRPLGVYAVPILFLHGGPGPTVLLTGGVHGDEFEGPAALMRLAGSLTVDEIQGRVIVLPAVSPVAVSASSRVSPLDGMNMNRAFPGDPNGGPTAMVAHYIETELIPRCDAAIDLHSGGKGALFAPCVLTALHGETGVRNWRLACAFGAPYIWMMNAQNDDRSVNAAAGRQSVPMIAVELGGGGTCDPAMTSLAEQGVRRCLLALGVIAATAGEHGDTVTPTCVEIQSARQHFIAPAAGLFDRGFRIGDQVKTGQPAGWLHFPDEPQRASLALAFPVDGIVFAHSYRGQVERGEMLAVIANRAAPPEFNA